MTAAHVFVEDVGTPRLADDDRRHLEGALRVRPGDEITVSDGRGRRRRCAFGDPPRPLEAVVEERRPRPALTVAFALVKGRRPELAVQKLTELGVDHIRPFVAERSVVRWDDERSERRHARLLRVAREAAMQSRRCWLPEVAPVGSFEDVAALEGAVLADASGGPPSLASPCVLVGPEGGWSPAERARGLAGVRLGPTVLRAETAAVVAGALLTALRAGVVAPPGGRSPD